MSVNTGAAGKPQAPRQAARIGLRPLRGRHMQIAGVEVVMKMRLHAWAILAGGIAVALAAFFASADITHWVMGLHHTVVVVRPGPTVYLPAPARHGHTHHRTPPAQVPAGPAYGAAGVPSHQDARARPDHEDHKGAHTRRDHRQAHARPGHRGRRLRELWQPPSASPQRRRTHLRFVYQTLGATSRTEAIERAGGV